MFENLTHLALQQYWWIIISILASILVFLMFVQGGQTLLYTLAKNEVEKTILVNSLGRKWEFTFTTLVTFGGAFFASFPLFYATSFGGAYWLWMLILFCFIIQAISYEFRSKPNNVFGSKTYEIFLYINGTLGTFLMGIAVGIFFNGAEFYIDEMNSSQWINKYHGLESIINLHNLLLGLTILFLARVLGILYFMNNVKEDNIFKRAKKHLFINSLPFVIFFIIFMIWLLLKQGFAYHAITKEIFVEKYKYLNNLIEMPLVGILFISGVILVLGGILKSLLSLKYKYGIWFSGIGTILVVFSLFIIAGFNQTAYYPSIYDLQSSITIENSSSSYYTLKTMTYVSFIIPIVITYIAIAWRSVNKKQIDKEEIKEDIHVY
ncbi:MAG: cytochrome d ubiquinol oxidase subunit II [Bacteroidales bacterium]|nr:cytochrome d ubiquinol oxidase subunit II [Bacteroidales bacterium]